VLKPKQQINFLDLIPIHKITEFTETEGRITLLLPKFKRKWMIKWLIPTKRSKHFRIHLDDMGSGVWKLIDGSRNTSVICQLLSDANTNESHEHLELRVTKFLGELYKNKFISFRNL
jgi:hypothetical protein